MKPGSVQLQQKLKTGMNVKATEGDRALSAFTAGSGCSMSADVIRLWAVQRVCCVRLCEGRVQGAHHSPHRLQRDLHTELNNRRCQRSAHTVKQQELSKTSPPRTQTPERSTHTVKQHELSKTSPPRTQTPERSTHTVKYQKQPGSPH